MAKSRVRETLCADPTLYLVSEDDSSEVLSGGTGRQVPLMPPKEIGTPRRGPGGIVGAEDGRPSRMKIRRMTEAQWEILVDLLGLPEPRAVARGGGDIEWGKQRGPVNPRGLSWVLVEELVAGRTVDRFLYPFLGPHRARGLRPRDLDQPMITGAELRAEWRARGQQHLSFYDWCAA